MAAVVVVLSFATTARAGAPDNETDGSLTFRSTTVEVHLTFTAVASKQQTVTNLSTSDFVVLRDGRPVDRVVSFGAYRQVPLSALVLTDVSDSMLRALPLERAASQWLRLHSDPSRDHLSFLDFGSEVESSNRVMKFNRGITSLYDSLIETLPRVAGNGIGRRAVILLTDGNDNYSLHSLGEAIAAAQRNDIAIYAITAHPSRKQYFRPDVLQRLCDETGGQYFEIRKEDAMLTAISAIHDQLRNGYELVFRPDSASVGPHQLSIQPIEAHLRFFYRSAYFQTVSAATETTMTQ